MKNKYFVVWLALFVLCRFAGADGYRTSVGEGDDRIPVAVLTGEPHEMGVALGALMRAEIQALVPAYLQAAQRIDERFSDAELDKAWDSASKYMTPRYIEEMKGMAEGSGLPFDTVRRAHMIPVISPFSCSAAAVWGKAAKNGHLYQIRNLDYTVDARLQDFPVVVVYIPKEGIPHMSISFAGIIGANTGMNAEGISLSEIGDSPESEYPYNLDGAHFMSLFRDILYDAHSLDEAESQLKAAKRIKRYYFVFGDGQAPAAVKIRSYAPELDIWKDNDPTDELAPNILPNMVYQAGGRNPIAYAHMNAYQGEYDADAMIQLSKAIGSLGGNLLNVVYDATALECWAAYAKDATECAYRRPYVHIKMNDYVPFQAHPEHISVEASYPAP